MSEERTKILGMLAEHKITVDEATRLLDALEGAHLEESDLFGDLPESPGFRAGAPRPPRPPRPPIPPVPPAPPGLADTGIDQAREQERQVREQERQARERERDAK